MRPPSFIVSQAQAIAGAVSSLRQAKSPSYYRLRRSSALLDAQLEPVFHKLKPTVSGCPDDLLALALLLAARADGRTDLMGALAADSRARSSTNDARVARFIRNTEAQDVFVHAQRFITQCKGRVSAFDVAAIALRWRDPLLDGLRKDLLSTYFREVNPK